MSKNNHMKEFDPICGYASVKRELVQIADFLRDPARYERVGARMPAGLLLDGEPGLGKTLMANCLVAASGLPTFVCRKNKQGEGMLADIRNAFAQAVESAPAIVLLDDMDKLSNSNRELRNTEEYVTVQSCIDECNGKGVFVIATCNESSRLPFSLQREGRFDRVIKLEPPRGEDCLAVVDHYLSKCESALGVDSRIVSDIVEGHSCAFLETVINEASLLAGFERADSIQLEHFIRAYARVEGQGLLLDPCESPVGEGLISPSALTDRTQVAYHEAGHIVAIELLRPANVSLSLIIDNQGSLSGTTKERPVADASTYQGIRANAIVAVAGALAVEQKFGIPGTGNGSDNDKAAILATKLLKDSLADGIYYFGDEEFNGSEPFRGNLEHALASLLEQIRWDARRMLALNRDALDAIAAKLHDDGYILAVDIARAMGRVEDKPEGKVKAVKRLAA